MTGWAILEVSGQLLALFERHFLVIKTDIMHIVTLDKGKPVEKRGRKSTGLRERVLRQRGYRSEY